MITGIKPTLTADCIPVIFDEIGKKYKFSNNEPGGKHYLYQSITMKFISYKMEKLLDISRIGEKSAEIQEEFWRIVSRKYSVHPSCYYRIIERLNNVDFECYGVAIIMLDLALIFIKGATSVNSNWFPPCCFEEEAETKISFEGVSGFGSF